MTHDKLLKEINQFHGETAIADLLSNALRAVVELHKPMKIGETLTVCRECFVMWENTPYPCATIQAIEKELE